eukprot:5855441-Pleurochrysis_carterae.AAC.1
MCCSQERQGRAMKPAEGSEERGGGTATGKKWLRVRARACMPGRRKSTRAAAKRRSSRTH